MKAIIFDSGPLISLTLNNLLWVLEPLKQRYKGDFFITQAVKEEVVDYPLKTKKFKFEAFQVLKSIREGVLSVFDTDYVRKETSRMMDLANSIFQIGGKPLRLLHYPEISVLVAAKEIKAEAVVVDEQSTRLLIENPSRMEQLVRKRMHTKVFPHKRNLERFQSSMRHINLIRSAELVTIAYESGFLNKYVAKPSTIPHPKEELLDSLLWGLKLNGCSISEKEINQILKVERKG